LDEVPPRNRSCRCANRRPPKKNRIRKVRRARRKCLCGINGGGQATAGRFLISARRNWRMTGWHKAGPAGGGAKAAAPCYRVATGWLGRTRGRRRVFGLSGGPGTSARTGGMSGFLFFLTTPVVAMGSVRRRAGRGLLDVASDGFGRVRPSGRSVIGSAGPISNSGGAGGGDGSHCGRGRG